MNDETWVDIKKWHERWEEIEKLPGGSQGDSFRVRRKTDGREAFLKAIKAKKDPERRARFFREASAYDTFSINGIPRLIESNAHQHKDKGFEPYIVTDFVEGPTLRKWRQEQSHVDLKTAVATTRWLLLTLRGCHTVGCVHRDIKPDNIILIDSNPAQGMLLDFGLNFHETPSIGLETENVQEIGNRFLRLPELSAGSYLKQDPRSDLTFAAGILFFMITGAHPDQLQDATGRLPHQRSEALAVLQNVSGIRYARLASLFDNAFAPQIADRFTNADAMLASIDRMMEDNESGSSAKENLTAILEVIDTVAERRLVETHKRFQESLNELHHVFRDVQNALGGHLVLSQTNYGILEERGKNTFFWKKLGSNERLMSTTCEVREAGDEIIIRLSGETIFRTPITSPHYGEEFRNTVREWILAQIKTAITDPYALPSEAENFKEYKPLARLTDAAENARRTRRNILAFVYDPTHGKRGNLQHGLSYFLQNKKTRETINATFVVALVPISQVSARSNILNGQSMESSRWIVFSPNLEPLEQSVIYANPQEGERISLDLAKRYGVG